MKKFFYKLAPSKKNNTPPPSKKSILSPWLLLCLAYPGFSGATTIDFETLQDNASVSNQFAAQGVTFSNAISLTAGLSLNEIDFPPHSGVTAISEDFSPLNIQFSSDASNISAYFTYASQLTFSAYDLGGSLIGTFINAGLDNLGTSELINLSFTGVRSLTIQGALPNSYTLDDLSFNTATVNTPIPGALFLFASGLMGIVLSKRKIAGNTPHLNAS